MEPKTEIQEEVTGIQNANIPVTGAVAGLPEDFDTSAPGIHDLTTPAPKGLETPIISDPSADILPPALRRPEKAPDTKAEHVGDAAVNASLDEAKSLWGNAQGHVMEPHNQADLSEQPKG